MADTVQGSVEEIAYRLFLAVAYVENKTVTPMQSGTEKATREWVLEAYAACLYAVQNPGLKGRS